MRLGGVVGLGDVAVHFGSLVAFSVTFTMCMVDYAWTRSVVKKKVALCVCFINGIAAITYWFFFW